MMCFIICALSQILVEVGKSCSMCGEGGLIKKLFRNHQMAVYVNSEVEVSSASASRYYGLFLWLMIPSKHGIAF